MAGTVAPLRAISAGVFTFTPRLRPLSPRAMDSIAWRCCYTMYANQDG